MSGRNAEEQDWMPRKADEVQEPPPNQGESQAVRDAWDRLNGWQR